MERIRVESARYYLKIGRFIYFVEQLILQPPCLAYLSDHQEGYELDYHIGMTPDGTSCGDGKVLFYMDSL